MPCVLLPSALTAWVKIVFCSLDLDVQTCRSLMAAMEKFIEPKKVRKGGGDMLPGSLVCTLIIVLCAHACLHKIACVLV